jgi:hypothetical protein
MPRLLLRVHRSAAYFRMQAIGGAWPGAGPKWGRFRPQNHARMVPSWLTMIAARRLAPIPSLVSDH